MENFEKGVIPGFVYFKIIDSPITSVNDSIYFLWNFTSQNLHDFEYIREKSTKHRLNGSEAFYGDRTFKRRKILNL